MKASKTETGFENSRVPSLQFQELAPWGHRKDARHIPAYPCSAGSRWPVFFSSWRQKEPNLIGSVRPVWPQNRNDDEPSQKWRSSSWFFNILKNGISDMMICTSWPQPNMAWYCIPYLPQPKWKLGSLSRSQQHRWWMGDHPQQWWYIMVQ